jgi:hypothetical protein
MDCPDFGVCNPSVIQPNVRRQATFLNRDTESVVALTPNIKLELNLHDQLGNQKQTCDLNSRRLASRRRLLIRAPLTGDPTETRPPSRTHPRRNQRFFSRTPPTTDNQQPTTGFLVELTGIEPVASWLQTRRSPS